MSALTVFNQSVTDLIPARKPAPPAPADKPRFDRQLKDADKKFNKPEPPADKTPAVKKSDESAASEQAAADQAAADQSAAPTDRDTQADTQDNPSDTQADQAQSTDSTDTAQDGTPTETTADNQDQADPTQTSIDPTAVEANSLLLQQQQTVVPTGEATSTQTTGVDQSGDTPQTQAVNTQQVQATESGTTQNPQAGDPQAGVNQGPVQPQQDKAAQSTPRDSAAQDQPSASSQRLAVVAEARQSDTRKSGSGDASSQQQPGALKADAQAAQSTTVQNLNASAPLTGGGTGAAAVGIQTVALGDNPTTPTTATPQVTPGAQTQGPDNTQLNTARIARGLQNAVLQKGGSVTLRLTPPEMGTVRIQLQMQNGTVNAQFQAEAASTRTLLNQQMAHLRTALESQGLNVERLGVQTLHQSSGSNLQNESQADREGQPNDGRSRGGFTRQGDARQDRSTPDEQSGFDQELNHAA